MSDSNNINVCVGNCELSHEGDVDAAIELLSRDVPRNTTVMPFLNGSLLGDKILFGMLGRYQATATNTILIDNHTSPRLQMFTNPSVNVWRATSTAVFKKTVSRLSDVSEIVSLKCFVDENSLPLSGNVNPLCISSFWEQVEECYRHGHLPQIYRYPTCEIGNLQEEGFFSDRRPNVVVHIRCIDRDPAKNFVEQMVQIVQAIVEQTRFDCILVGKSDQRPIVSGERILDLLNPRFTFEDLLDVIQSCTVFLGNDSGPIHVASALGVPVIRVAATNELFGPYVPRDRLLADLPASDIGLIDSVVYLLNQYHSEVFE